MTDVPAEAGPFRLLFVCTGNTCRSPMAEVIARRRVEELGWEQIRVGSAGVAAFDGSPASDGALRAAGRKGLDLSAHTSSLLTPRMVADADLVLAMSTSHLARVFELGGAEKAALITSFAAPDEPGDGDGDGAGGGVPDPIGGADEEYLRTFEVLEELVERALERLEPVVRP